MTRGRPAKLRRAGWSVCAALFAVRVRTNTRLRATRFASQCSHV